MLFAQLNNDQSREMINARQRYQAWREAAARQRGYRGSMVWAQVNGAEYLVRSYYDENNKRRQKSLGRRDAGSEAIKAAFDLERQNAETSRKRLDESLDRQAAVNRALGLNRVPWIAAAALRLLDKRGLLGAGIRVAGTNALFAYEAACGVQFDAEITATSDIDLLFDARRRLFLIGDADFETRNLIDLLKLADRSFRRAERTYAAVNDDGYIVELIKPQRTPPWVNDRPAIGDADDLQAAEIESLVWLENAPAFEQPAIDQRGYPVRIVAPDPRVFAIHKHWLSKRPNRDGTKRQRDFQQAMAVATLVKTQLQHLPFDPAELRMLPKAVVDEALEAFSAAKTEG